MGRLRDTDDEDEYLEVEEEECRSPVVVCLSPEPIRKITTVSRVHPVNTVEDIIESARHFSPLTDPQEIKRLCCEKVPTWKIFQVDPSMLEAEQIVAGLTNQLFQVSLLQRTSPQSNSPQPTAGSKAVESRKGMEGLVPVKVLFRVYGTAVGDLYDPEREFAIFRLLSEVEAAPKLFASFPGGRIEEFIKGHSLKKNEMDNPSVLCAVATVLARFHRLAERLPRVAEFNDESCHYEPTSTEALMIQRMKSMSDSDSADWKKRFTDLPLDAMTKEIPDLLRILQEDDDHLILQPAFCHNDVQENNILVSGTRIRLIDFEYSSYNYPAFDIANFFAEMRMDYCVDQHPYFTHDVDPANFPDEELIRLFGSVYMSARCRATILPSHHSLDRFVSIVKKFVLSSHLLWSFWSIIRFSQANTSGSFDFKAYALSRWQAYLLWKKHISV
ncbi:choline kinase [Gregarina niphandrodes]|uniref:Choline kinase n=1 Tax=Gregarina niphandrodes TaxID=110365 RepID=A0A023B9K7_GRENI|nr:choline kinase [Gregarina niphandrodes]EZG72976.1 choline kinase [Gregarina niphandrodes]|eukprot:XP_011129671.1 choline kinase [Gregarina niphandrodes]